MIFNTSERKAIFMLILLIVGIFILPQQFKASETDLFWIPQAIEEDSIPLEKISPKEKIFSIYRIKTPPIPIELNQTDSSTLVKIKGIGPYYAAKIIRYREQLGGFYSIKQLKELKMKYFDVDSNIHRFTINPAYIRVSDLDTASFKFLVRHPYLEYNEVQLIFNAKRKYGHVNCDTIEKHGILTLFKLKKIRPYFK